MERDSSECACRPGQTLGAHAGTRVRLIHRSRTSANSCFPKRSRPALPDGARHPGIFPTFPELVVMSCTQELNRRCWLRQCNSYTVQLTHSSRLPGSLTKPEGLQEPPRQGLQILTGENPIMSPRIIPDFNEKIVIPEQKVLSTEKQMACSNKGHYLATDS